MLQFVDSQAICSPKDPLRCEGEEAWLAFSDFRSEFSGVSELLELVCREGEVRGGDGSRWRHQLLLFCCAKSELHL